ncbi:serine/threonine-protein kinase HT1-like [Canna indica]|uniref:Serine/threonine-protein kinase HT1-like n=1 Tax=Canna indica TaxID=4628 RepID=A0AAQ3QA28_9LILI|nr:serine/threonine-protein kinase HT1-like [Canna indica]
MLYYAEFSTVPLAVPLAKKFGDHKFYLKQKYYDRYDTTQERLEHVPEGIEADFWTIFVEWHDKESTKKALVAYHQKYIDDLKGNKMVVVADKEIGSDDKFIYRQSSTAAEEKEREYERDMKRLSTDFSFRPDRETKVSPKNLSLGSPVLSSQHNQDPALKKRGSNFSSNSVSKLSINTPLESNISRRSFKLKQRSASPLPTIVLSDVFQEAKADQKRFSTSSPMMRGADKNVFSKLFSREGHHHPTLHSPIAEAKTLHNCR